MKENTTSRSLIFWLMAVTTVGLFLWGGDMLGRGDTSGLAVIVVSLIIGWLAEDLG